MQGQILAVEYAKGLDYSGVRHDDRPELERIVEGLVTFERIMPRLQVDIHDAGDHYLLSVKGYNQSIDLLRFYNKFLGENSPYDFIQGVRVTPSSGIFVIDVKKRDFSESRPAEIMAPPSARLPTSPSPSSDREMRSRSRSSRSRSRRSRSRRK